MNCERCGGIIVERSFTLASGPVEEKVVFCAHCLTCGRDEYRTETPKTMAEQAGAANAISRIDEVEPAAHRENTRNRPRQ